MTSIRPKAAYGVSFGLTPVIRYDQADASKKLTDPDKDEQVLRPGQAASSTIVRQSRKRIRGKKTVVSSPFTFVCFRSCTRRRFSLRFDLIEIDGGTDEIF